MSLTASYDFIKQTLEARVFCATSRTPHTPRMIQSQVSYFFMTLHHGVLLLGVFFEMVGCVLNYWTTFTTWWVLRQFWGKLFLNTFTTFKTPLSMFFFPKVEELTLCKDKTSITLWVPVPQTSSLRREADGLTKMLQVKNVSKSHHLSCWAKTAVGNVLYATLCLLRRSQLSIYFLKSDPKAFLLQPAASQGPHLWQIISGCGRKVGTNLVNPIWDQ